LIDYLDALRTATAGRTNYLADPRLQRTCLFPLYFTMPPDGMADFADGYYRGELRPMPNTVYPYVRTGSASARDHLFLSVFLIRPAQVTPGAVWIRMQDGLALKHAAHSIRIVADVSRHILTAADPESGWLSKIDYGSR
jgi:hypothetical protein